MPIDRPPPVRLVPDISLPPYSYVPGMWPHPTSDPRGHNHFPQAPTDEGQFRFACDLFNHGYYWEAHEAWEALWHAAGRRGPEADFLKGLIQLAAAGVKAREGQPHGVARHANRAAELWRSVAPGERHGLSPGEMIAAAEAIAASVERSIDTTAASVVRVFAIELSPR